MPKAKAVNIDISFDSGCSKKEKQVQVLQHALSWRFFSLLGLFKLAGVKRKKSKRLRALPNVNIYPFFSD